MSSSTTSSTTSSTSSLVSEPVSPSRSIKSYNSISSNECFICMEKTNDPVLNILDFDVSRSCRCDAKLHSKCYVNWLRTSISCPICRTPIPMDESVQQQEIESYQRRPSRVIYNPLNLNENQQFVIDRLPNYVIVERTRRQRIKLFCEYLISMCLIIVIVVFIIYFASK